MARVNNPFSAIDGSPWTGQPVDVYKSICSTIACDGVAVAVWSVDAPAVDELLVAHGLPAQSAARFADPEFLEQPFNQEAFAHGCGRAENASHEAVKSAGHIMVQAWPYSLKDRQWWWMMLVRHDRPFTEEDEAITSLFLQNWAAHFNRPDEEHMGRLLLGNDNRLICADLATQAKLLDHPDALDDLLSDLQLIVEQRFPDLEETDSRDFVANVAGQPNWVIFRRDQATSNPESSHWYLELRTLQADELPVLGPIDDERIARAIAYLHANYHESPSLAQIARAVHTSPFHFHRLFTKEVGVSPKQYLQRRQLQVAKWLLRATREPIGAIAGETGFASHGHFTSTFHRVVGVSPSDYRDQAAMNGSRN